MSRNENNITIAANSTEALSQPSPAMKENEMSELDNGSASPPSPLSSSPNSKLCHIVKRPDFEGYGFNLHSEKIKPGQYIGKVDANSPAQVAGLKEGDRIIEVNGVPIGNETHKQVVQRIKAIPHEVRLLLIDVDANGMGSATPTITEGATTNSGVNMAISETNGNGSTYQATVREMPGASANISSISVVSTKRLSNASNHSQSPVLSLSQSGNGIVETSAKISTNAANSTTDLNGNQALQQHGPTLSTPPPPSTVKANAQNQQQQQQQQPSGDSSNPPAVVHKVGSLQLPMTAAEMRAKLLAKKKYDPKNESVDLKKKFEIIQKL